MLGGHPTVIFRFGVYHVSNKRRDMLRLSLLPIYKSNGIIDIFKRDILSGKNILIDFIKDDVL